MTDKQFNILLNKRIRTKDTPCIRTDCLMHTDSIKAQGSNHCRGLNTCENNGVDCPFYKKSILPQD